MASEQDQAKAMLLMLKGAVAELPAEDQKKLEAAVSAIRGAVQKHGDEGLAALALVGLELGALQ